MGAFPKKNHKNTPRKHTDVFFLLYVLVAANHAEVGAPHADLPEGQQFPGQVKSGVARGSLPTWRRFEPRPRNPWPFLAVLALAEAFPKTSRRVALPPRAPLRATPFPRY